MIEQSGHFAVSILAEGQEAISGFFAVSGREPVEAYTEFETLDWVTGSPLIGGALAHLDCEVDRMVPGGDHTIAIGRVVGADSHPGKKPLIYYRRGYRSLVLD
jgi:flavin reductase (DIM6/NTAB) family NADH-FMN oxidoreductase RutF